VDLLLRDDGSSDDTPAVMRGLAAEFRNGGYNEVLVFQNEAGPNLIAGRNFLAGKVPDSSGLMLVMDDDVYLEPDFLRKMAEFYSTLEGCAAIGPRAVFESAREKTAACANFVSRITGAYSEAEAARPLECDWLSSCCLLVNMAAWKKVGGLCAAFHTAHEEPDFCMRVKSAGFSVVYFPLVTVRHDVSIRMQRRAGFYYLYRNKMWFIRRNLPMPWKYAGLLGVLLVGTPKYLLESLFFHRKIVLSEIRDILRAVWDGVFLKW
jgi:GT2 family glycosyltransferase